MNSDEIWSSDNGAPLTEIQKEGTAWQEGDVGFSD
jgi:hypothetical protein